jgi:hypothetical protein
MSLGQRKMRAKADALAPSVLICGHRGMEWIVITGGGFSTHFYYGKEGPNGPVSETNTGLLASVSDDFKPWAKKLLKDYNNLRTQNENKVPVKRRA